MIDINVLITSSGVASAVNVISALKKSKKFNVKIHATDMDQDAVGLYIADDYSIISPSNHPNYLDEILEIIERKKINFVFPMHSSEIEIFSKNIKIFQDKNIGLIVPPIECVKLCNSKRDFFKFMEFNNIPIPRLYKYEECHGNFPLFIKPNTGSSSYGAMKLNSIEELDFNFKSKVDEYIIQEFIDWDEITVDCYVSTSDVLIGCVPRYRVKVKDGKSVVSKTFKNSLITSACKEILSLIKYRGVCNLQFFIKEHEYKLIEINPRFAAGGLSISTEAGINIPELMIMDNAGMLLHKLHDYNKNLKMFRYFTEVFV